MIVGFGIEGRSAFDYLKKKYPKSEIAIADEKTVNNPPKGTELFLGKNYLEKICEYDVVIKSPGTPSNLPEFKKAQKHNVKITTVTNLFFEKFHKRTIGVTGTKGKSTTATLIYKILKQAGKDVHLLGNIGDCNPFIFFDEKKFSKSIFIYELSSYQLQDQRQSPHVAVFINIFPDHLPYHGSFEKYKKAKANIAKYQDKNDFFVYNSDYAFIKNLSKKSQALPVDYLNKCHLKNNAIFYGKEKVLDINNIKLLGIHNIKNICASICAAKIFKIKNQDIKNAVENFSGLEHRLEFVRKIKGADFYDDAISTTPESTMAAMEVFKERIGVLILGGEDRGYNFKKLAKRIFELKIKNIVLFPDSGKNIWQEIVKIYNKNNLTLPKKLETKSMEQAVKFAYKNILPGHVCLLSTASPSYSVFKDFKEKGERFKRAVRSVN